MAEQNLSHSPQSDTLHGYRSWNLRMFQDSSTAPWDWALGTASIFSPLQAGGGSCGLEREICLHSLRA